jgi:hypothetical protein
MFRFYFSRHQVNQDCLQKTVVFLLLVLGIIPALSMFSVRGNYFPLLYCVTVCCMVVLFMSFLFVMFVLVFVFFGCYVVYWYFHVCIFWDYLLF